MSYGSRGEGLLNLPLHRSWLIGPFHEGFRLNRHFQSSKRRAAFWRVLSKKTANGPTPTSERNLDWDFFSRFEQSLLDYRISYRMLPEADVGKPVVIVTSGSDKFKFVLHRSENLGRLSGPATRWLDVSSDWGFWFDLDSGIWRDRYASEIEKAEAAGVSADQRLEIMRGLDKASLDPLSRSAFITAALTDQKEDLKVRIAGARAT